MTVNNSADNIHYDFLNAVRSRVKYLDRNFSRNSPQCERAGLVWVSRVVDILARRFLRPPDWPGHVVDDQTKLLWELDWYSQFCEAAAQISQSIQSAVKENRLVLRSALTRLPYDKVALETWLSEDIPARRSARVNEIIEEAATLNMVFGDWPDKVGRPPGAVAFNDLINWAGAEGMATEAELKALLAAAPALPPTPPAIAATQTDVVEGAKVTAVDDIPESPLQKGVAQESEILAAIGGLEHDPTCLPKPSKGMPGVKKQVWEKVGKITAKDGRPLFLSRNAFDSQWERMRKNNVIRDAEI